MNINNVEVSVLVNGQPVKFFAHNGRTFICANYGAEYEIKIKNNNYYRIMAVISVDGLCVLDGKPASKDGTGYVLNGYSSYSIKGFRKDHNTVGAFKFTKKKKGYAKEVTGSSENSGIIAIAVFAEKQIYQWTTTSSLLFNADTTQNQYYNTCGGYVKTRMMGEELIGGSLKCSAGNEMLRGGGAGSTSLNSASAAGGVNINYCSSIDGSRLQARAQNMVKSVKEEVPNFAAATTWGQKLDDRVINTTFEKASAYPMAEFNIYYDVRQNLEKIGIVFQPQKQVNMPKAFPAGFATPPANWHA